MRALTGTLILTPAHLMRRSAHSLHIHIAHCRSSGKATRDEAVDTPCLILAHGNRSAPRRSRVSRRDVLRGGGRATRPATVQRSARFCDVVRPKQDHTICNIIHDIIIIITMMITHANTHNIYIYIYTYIYMYIHMIYMCIYIYTHMMYYTSYNL